METKNVYQRLLAVMESVSYVQKEDKKVNNQYRFVSHDAVAAKVRPALIANGIVPTVSVKHHSQDGNMTTAVLTVRFVNVDNPADFVEVDSFGYGIDPQDKGPGKAVSYAFKYALLKTLCLETGDDPERDLIPRVTSGYDVPNIAAQVTSLYEANEREKAWKVVLPLAMDDDANDERLKLWKLLAGHSAVRSFIKAQTTMTRAAQEENDGVPA